MKSRNTFILFRCQVDNDCYYRSNDIIVFCIDFVNMYNCIYKLFIIFIILIIEL